jgi:hypothetical protein
MDLRHWTNCYGIQQMGMKDSSLIEEINLKFIAHTTMAIHQCLSDRTAGEYRVPPEFGPGGGAQRKCDTKSINPAVDDTYADVFRNLDTDFCSSSPEVEDKQ